MKMPLELRGGPLDGEVIQAEVDETALPAKWLPVPPDYLTLPYLELDESTETCRWTSTRYARNWMPFPRPGVPWTYIHLPITLRTS